MKQQLMMWQWHQQMICISLQTDNHANTSSLNFYRPDCLADTERTVSKQSILCTYYQIILYHISNKEQKVCD